MKRAALVLSAAMLSACQGGNHTAFYGIPDPIPVINGIRVTDYGATPNDGIDDTDAIRNAAAEVQRMGGGTLLFAPGTFTVFSNTTGVLGGFFGLTGVSVLGYGTTLEVPPAKQITASEGTFFYFSNCQNITVDGFTTNGPVLDVSQTAVLGYEFVRCVRGCRNLSMPGNRVVNSLAGLIVSKTKEEPDSYRTQDIHVGTLDVVNCWYGINGQFSGDRMAVDNLRTDTVHRSCFIYGASDLTLNITSKNHKGTDVPLSAIAGVPMENVDLTYRSRANSTECGNAGKVQLGFSGPDASLMRNVRIRMDVTYADHGSTGGTALSIRKVDPLGNSDFLDRGHVLDGLTATGHIRGSCSYIGLGNPRSDFSFDINCIWGPGDTFSNMDLTGLAWINP